ncbi:type I-C CRISPR-associated protein Cas7/Csd2 [Pyramidobacter piscolens]|uniref:CRISPR-associated protein, Csd2 family n=1 Tax=Pyramidobacter piscolens W5455 TaxID=352165 RepID=A0ABM9ZVD7_9BACT|nr:type I-C CRISPR-associated protein Cas7/Csd2 [Pyramidobacter piscolens]EFB90882.1 hypothetical protein HMPREF7215_1798 [Pyramidobacter piscolens W5455]BDF79586.1 type I-C CRISPR-associated protein Cas7/Csd2 [Pyramidobacter piscolens]
MSVLQNKIDFAVILSVNNANPNGDPLNGNRPRENYDGYGEISDVCLKRKIRNRWQDLEQKIFVQAAERADDGYNSLKERAEKELSEDDRKDRERYAREACKKWLDVRSFGQVFAFDNKNDDEEKGKGVSVGVRGPVTVQSAMTVLPVNIDSMQITKSVNGKPTKDGSKSPDTMGMKHRVAHSVYVFYGSINCQLAEKTGFSEEDAELLHKALITLFENDASSARPDGSMEVKRVYWWKHNCKTGQYSSAQVHRSLSVTAPEDATSWREYKVEVTPLDGLNPEEYSAVE